MHCACAEGRSGSTCSDKKQTSRQKTRSFDSFGIGLIMATLFSATFTMSAFRNNSGPPLVSSRKVRSCQLFACVLLGIVSLYLVTTIGIPDANAEIAGLSGAGGDVLPSLRVALAVIVLFPEYHARYMYLLYDNHAAYARKHNYTLVVVTEWINAEPGQPGAFSGASMQKYAVLNTTWAQMYDYVVVLDADIFITPSAPALHSIFPSLGRGVGAVDEYEQPTGVRFEDRGSIPRLMNWCDSPEQYFALAGFKLNTSHVLNGGFLIFQPAYHSEFALYMWLRYGQASRTHPRGMHFEQAATGYELITRGLWSYVPSVWNAAWILQRLHPLNNETLQQFIDRNYFVHLAGGDIKLLEAIADSRGNV